jgi:DNA end-binding protein Ku
MARSIWSGTVSFGLVSVPVKLVSATESKELRCHFLHKKNGSYSPIGYDKIDRETGESIDPDEIVRGFEIDKGRYVDLMEALRVSVEQTKKSRARRPRAKKAS